MDGEALDFGDNTFDVVYAHGVLQYTADIQQMIDDFCEQPTPDSQSELAERSLQLNRIVNDLNKSR